MHYTERAKKYPLIFLLPSLGISKWNFTSIFSHPYIHITITI